MLVQLISRSKSPEVSLAFLNELYVRESDNREVTLQLIDNYYRVGSLDKASELTTTILTRKDGSKDWVAFKLYLQLLIERLYQANTDTNVNSRLRRLIKEVGYIPEADLAREYADAAISLSMPKSAFDILSPHLQSGETTQQELISLALQYSDYDSAIKLQHNTFMEHETLEDAKALLKLFASSDSAWLAQRFILKYKGVLSQDPEFIKLTIEHLKLTGNVDIALYQSQKLLTLQPSNALYASTAELALANANLPLATSLLAKAVKTNPSSERLAKLHDLYRWQGNTQNAFRTSLQLLNYEPSENQLRAGIEESRALGDISNESVFYQHLASNNLIKSSEYSNWLSATEKAVGTDEALTHVKRLAQLRPRDTALIMHQARLYGYKNDYKRVIKQSQKLASIRKPTTIEAIRFSNAYIMANQPNLALAVLTSPIDWLDTDDNYLNLVARLAWQTSNLKLSRLSQDQLAARSSHKFDLYRYVRIYSPMNQDNIDHLIELYHQSGDSAVLLAAIQAAQEIKDKALFAELVSLAAGDPALINNPQSLLFQAQLATEKPDYDHAFMLYKNVLAQEPLHKGAISGLLWLNIESNDHDKILETYNRYKKLLRDDSDLWLGFATAAQILGHFKEAELWYRQLLIHTDKPDVAIVLNYAALLEAQGQYDTAFTLRRYIASQLSDELLRIDDGDIAYHSLVTMFIGRQFAQTMSEHAALSEPDSRNVADMFLHYLASNQADNLLFWHQRTAFKHFRLPDWQQLSLAIQQRDRQKMERLLNESVNLPISDKNVALQLTGQHQKAWQQGQNKIGQHHDPQAENQLRHIHVNQHPGKTHGVRSQFSQNTQWDITKYSLDYYAPHHSGYWRLGSDYQTTGTPELLQGNHIDNEFRLRGKYNYQHLESAWQFNLDFADGVGEQRLGFSARYQTPIDSYWNTSIELGVNRHIEASQLLNITGQENILGLAFNYQPTTRESVAIRFNLHDLSTRFNDDIGHGWDLNLRLSEQLFFTDPAWQLYADVSLQDVNLSSSHLEGINDWHQGERPLTSADFIEEKYQRLAIGQRVWHGEPGTPGATVPSPRYWFDSSLGYNVILDRMDIALSAGLGWRIVGNDELYFSADWQSQDRNGDESLKLSFGYYYGF
ncbi:tetratricopeptide repeat protein [Photobacterium sp. SDRW27]|uniref:tetratricopeptide repeat protein n=1 Tax=Photobacterium obscurum TaxID=2829490 RepID=UPI0022437F59|nr:tetratricopeptide repeat protein [Photobacterium obscurum]MCW8329349.1 tetratricopeptide repeat protein [Photobacterium obscurum]